MVVQHCHHHHRKQHRKELRDDDDDGDDGVGDADNSDVQHTVDGEEDLLIASHEP